MTTGKQPIAHAAKDSGGNWRPPHDLAEHLAGVASVAACFARTFGEDWARLAGQWHDLGKYRPAFQDYIRHAAGFDVENAHIEGNDRVDHSTAGAVHAIDEIGEAAGRMLAYLISGHHAGLPDWNGSNSSLLQRLESAREAGYLKEALQQSPPAEILRGVMPSSRPKGNVEGLHLWLRMLFSSLVDADFLDTEAYMEPDKSDDRDGHPNIDTLLKRFNTHMAQLAAKAAPTKVNHVRANVLRQCIEQAGKDRGSGLYSLTVPTGGGKTLSSLAFALHHANKHHKKRVIYAIPYLTIIEQTADTFRDIFGEDVIEHHSNLDPDKETARSRLAAENWDAPLVVTTNVQLFESLYAARTSRCRKLHNLVDSVVILDEAQLLPPEFLEPCLAAIRVMSKNYGVTFVLCTATQPAFQPRDINGQAFKGLADVGELMRGGPYVLDPLDLYRDLERVKTHWPDLSVTTNWDDLAARVNRHDQALTIVNRKTHARELTKRLPASLYLSTNLCGAHRAERIAEIRLRLAANRERAKADLPVCPIHVVSTQLIEAGVDVDFPVVFRALAGLDSIAQAAGRCNREGLLISDANRSKGEVHIFVPPEPAPLGLLLKGEQATRALLAINTDPDLAPELFDHYFRLWYAAINSFDEKEVLKDLTLDAIQGCIQFRTAAEKFRLIPDEGVPVIVRWGESEKWLRQLKSGRPDRWLMRKLQRYTVNVRRDCLNQLIGCGVEEILPGLYEQTDNLLYDETFGFLGCAGNIAFDPTKLIVSGENNDA